MHPYLPPELLEIIIEQIKDRETLAACSLVCHAWAPIAQSKIFRNLSFGSSPVETTRFFKMIRKSPHIALLPRSIMSNRWDVIHGDNGIYLAQIAPLLINVSKLTLTAVRLSSYPSPNSRRNVDGFPSLRELHFINCTVELRILSSLFQLHPTLGTLSLGLGTKISTAEQHQGPLPLRGLQHLHVSSLANTLPLLPLLIDGITPLARIKHLELIPLRPGDDAVYTLLYGLRHVLQVLMIGLSWFAYLDNGLTLDGMCIPINFCTGSPKLISF
jgi:F-box-like